MYEKWCEGYEKWRERNFFNVQTNRHSTAPLPAPAPQRFPLRQVPFEPSTHRPQALLNIHLE